MTGVSFRRGMR